MSYAAACRLVGSTKQGLAILKGDLSADSNGAEVSSMNVDTMAVDLAHASPVLEAPVYCLMAISSS